MATLDMRPVKIIRIILFLGITVGCGGLISLDLPNPKLLEKQEKWLMLGGNQQHQHFSLKNIHPPLEEVWTKSVKSVVTDHPLAVGDIIFAPTQNGELYVIDYITGGGMGSGKIGPAMAHLPTIHNNILYAGMVLGSKTLIAFHLRRAEKKYTARYPYITTSPLIIDDKIYFGTEEKMFFCANLGTGEEIWNYEAHAPIRSSPAYNSAGVVFGDDKGWIYALDPASGIKRWDIQLDGPVFSHPVLDDSSVFVGTVNGTMYCLNIRTGKINWQKSFPGAIYGSPSLYKNVLYFGNNAHDVIALHKDSGEKIWSFKTKGIVNTVPLPSPDYLYVTSWDKNLYVLNRFSGKLIFKYPFKKTPKSSPIIYRDYLLIHTANAKLIALANEKFVRSRREKQ